MTNADKLFEQLGYEQFENEFCLKDSNFRIVFVSNFKSVLIESDEEKVITMQELKAITKKCEELGWLGEC